MDGQITIGNVTLAEPHELTLHAAPLAGYWCRCFKPKMYVFILLIRIHQLVPRKA